MVLPGIRNTTDVSKEVHSPKPSAIPASCGQALEHSTAPSQDSVVTALPYKEIPAGKSSQGTAVSVAQHLPAPQQGCEAKPFTPNPGEGSPGGSQAACQAGCQAWQYWPSAWMTWAPLPIFPYSQKWRCYFLLIEPLGLRSAAGSWERQDTQPRE